MAYKIVAQYSAQEPTKVENDADRRNDNQQQSKEREQYWL